ncbi:MAG: hypothetical protein LAT52_10470, partial [Balneolales bacterium]|nr:hypothetical protein [Balneolales bacterium]
MILACAFAAIAMLFSTVSAQHLCSDAHIRGHSSQLSGSQTLDAFTATPMPLTRVFAIHPEHREQLHPSNAREL